MTGDCNVEIDILREIEARYEYSIDPGFNLIAFFHLLIAHSVFRCSPPKPSGIVFRLDSDDIGITTSIDMKCANFVVDDNPRTLVN